MTKGAVCADGVPLVQVDETASDIELSIHNELSELEVVHIHGLRFQIMSMSLEGFTHDVAAAPVLRDTVAIAAGESVTLRVMADNPGMWMVHAMGTNSFERGAATVLSVLPSQFPAVPSDVPRDGPCAAQAVISV